MREMLWFVRMTRMVKNPPSKERVLLVSGIVLAAGALVAIDMLGLWPDFLTVNSSRGIGLRGGTAIPVD